MRNIIIGFLSLTFSIGLISCEKETQPYQFVAIAQSDIGKKLVDSTDLFADIQKDTSYTLLDGVEVAEIKYLSATGLSMKIFVFEIDLSQPTLSIEASTPFNKPNFAMQPMTVQATYEDKPGHMVWGGINGDFYNMTTGLPHSIVHKEGVAIKNIFADKVNTFFAITKNKKAIIGDQELYAEVQFEIVEAVGGRVQLVENGIVLNQTDTRLEPRTAIGVSEDGKKVYMLAVDGRNFHYSNGMDYKDMGKILKALGAYNAINLDGGGSTTFFTRNTIEFTPNRFELRNWPTDNGGKERAVANGLLIIAND